MEPLATDIGVVRVYSSGIKLNILDHLTVIGTDEPEKKSEAVRAGEAEDVL